MSPDEDHVILSEDPARGRKRLWLLGGTLLQNNLNFAHLHLQVRGDAARAAHAPVRPPPPAAAAHRGGPSPRFRHADGQPQHGGADRPVPEDEDGDARGSTAWVAARTGSVLMAETVR